MKLGSSRAMDTKPPRGSERSKPRHELQLTRRSQPPYPWPPEQAQPGVSKPCRTKETTHAGLALCIWRGVVFFKIVRNRPQILLSVLAHSIGAALFEKNC